MWKESVCSFQNIWSMTFLMGKKNNKYNKREAINEEEHTETQTWLINDRGDSDENQAWSVTVIEEGMWEYENVSSSKVL